MVQNYADVIAKQKEIGTAKVLNPNLQTQRNQDQARVDQENKQIIQDYIDSKIKEGYKLNPDGSLTKEIKVRTGKQRGKQTYKITTTTITVDQQGQVQTSTQTRSTKTGSSSDPLVSKANQLERALRDIDSGKSQASPSTRSSLQNQLNQTYELIRNRKGNQSFVTVPSEQVVSGGSVFDITGKGYSVAPALQEQFIKEKNESLKKDVVVPQNVQSAFTVPRPISDQETSSIPLRIKESKLSIVAPQEFGGVMNVRRIGDFNNRYDEQNNLVTPTPIDTTEMTVRNAINKLEINSFIGDLQINPFLKVKDTPLIAVGIVSGVFSASRLGFNIIQASNLNPVTENQLAIQKRIGQGVLDVIKDPFKKLVADPVETVASNPLYEGSKLATELVLLEGASRGAKVVVKEVGATNKFLKSDVQASAYDLSRSSERASVFLKENQISPNTVGTPEFTPVPQLTVDVSAFNKNQRYFSEPKLDVPVDRQFTLAGTEVKPPVNPKGIFPLEEKTVTPFESNKLTIEQIGKKPLIDAVSTAQSRVVDLPVAKSFNKDTLQGTPILDLQNPERSSFISQDLKQTTLAPIENKVSSVPKGSQKPLIYEKVKPVENKPVIDNSFAFESSGSVVVAESSGSPVSLPARSFGSEKILKVNAEYVLDSASGEYIRKVGDVELNLDIKGKVTPQKFGVSGASIGGLPQTQQPTQIVPKIQVDQIQSPKINADLSSGLKSGSDLKIDIVSDQGQKPRTKIVQLQSPIQLQDQVSVQEQQTKEFLSLKQESVQKVQPRLLSPRIETVEIIKPLLPTVRSERQVKSGAGLFDVLVRKEGKFVKVGSGYSDLATAFNRGKQEVKNTARASFKVVSRLGEPQRFNLGSDRSLTRSKRDANVVVQKREFRISSEGEKTEISRKGVFTQKLKRKGIFK